MPSSATTNWLMTEFYTTGEVAALLRTAASTLRYWRMIGEGPPHFKAGRRYLYPRADFEAWVQAQPGMAPPS